MCRRREIKKRKYKEKITEWLQDWLGIIIITIVFFGLFEFVWLSDKLVPLQKGENKKLRFVFVFVFDFSKSLRQLCLYEADLFKSSKWYFCDRLCPKNQY